jgi:uncharacterized protein
MSSAPRHFELSVLPESLAIAQLAVTAPIPVPKAQSFFSITRTADELSLVCSESEIPENANAQTGWRALKLRGPFDLSEVGVLSSIATTLAEASITLFVISTFNTDYLLVHAEQLQSAVTALERAGHKIQHLQTTL